MFRAVFALVIISALVASILSPWKVLAAQDNTAPNLTAYSMSATSFSTESTDQTLTLSVTLTDDQAGVCSSSDCGSFFNGSSTSLRMLSDSGGSQHVDFTNFTRTG